MRSVDPIASVVVPSRNRSESLQRVLLSLQEQDTSCGGFEVIVALNGCIDESIAALDTLKPRFPLTVLEIAEPGAARARNRGAAVARGEVLIFLDDDIDVAPHFVQAHLSSHAVPRRVSIGYAKPFGQDRSLFGQAKRAWWEEQFSNMAKPDWRFSYRDLLAGNFSLRVTDFAQVGGFDDTFGCREDYELGWRLLSAALGFQYIPNARGVHRDFTSQIRSFQRRRAEGLADVHFAARHSDFKLKLPEHWSRMPSGLGWRRLVGHSDEVLFELGDRRLRALEASKRRGAWNRLNQQLGQFWYQQGLREGLSSLSSAESAAIIAPQRTRTTAMPSFDLSNGIDVVAKMLDDQSPSSARIEYSGQLVCVVPPQCGAEPLAGRHLSAILRDHLPALAQAKAMSHVIRMPSASVPPLKIVNAPRGAILVDEVDLAEKCIRPRQGEIGSAMRLLVRSGRRPLGWADLDALGPDANFGAEIRCAVERQLTWPALKAATFVKLQGALGAKSELQPISIVICTRDRTENLKRCLEAIAELEGEAHEVIVVDDAPSTSTTQDYVQGLQEVRYVREDRPGLDWARNHGWEAARFELIAFTDDDTKVDRHWLTGLREAFEQPEVLAVTGLVAPMKLETPAQRYFEDVYGGMGKGFEPRWFRRGQMAEGQRLWASACGVGANMAFRKSVFEKLGGFNVALDVGTATRGGGDIEMFHRVICNGGTLAYAPAAIVWHEHRATWEGLARQLRDNGSGFMAYLLACREARTVSGSAWLRFVLVSWLLRWLLRRVIRPGRHRRRLVVEEIIGAFQGIWRYRQAKRRAAALGAGDKRSSHHLAVESVSGT
jgi:glycosyltransferase involved in cell wall biosynthesis